MIIRYLNPDCSTFPHILIGAVTTKYNILVVEKDIAAIFKENHLVGNIGTGLIIAFTIGRQYIPPFNDQFPVWCSAKDIIKNILVCVW